MSDVSASVDELVLTERRGDVWCVTLNDPKTRNAMGWRMCKALAHAFQNTPGDARAVYVTGAADSFCSGANLLENAETFMSPDRDLGAALDENYHPIFAAIRALNAPVIIGVNGPAVGIGLSLSQMGDLIVAAHTSYFALGFAKIGLAPDGGATWLLPRSMGRARAMQFYMENTKVPGSEAIGWGLATHVLLDEGFQAAAFAIAEAAASGPTRAIALTRRAIWESFDNSYADQLRVEMAVQREAGRTDDFMEGVTAFMEKRPAAYKGE